MYEVKIGNELLMSSTVNASERALARLALEVRRDQRPRVLVGGLGLGYTAAAVLDFPNVQELVVIELLAPVLDWHRRRLVPMAGRLLDDPRCSLVEGNFFERVGPNTPADPDRLFDAILVDIDHSAESWLQARHGDFYTEAGLRSLRGHLQPNGIFGFWSAERPTKSFLDLVRGSFPSVQSHEISFPNPHLGVLDSNWVVLGEAGSP